MRVAVDRPGDLTGVIRRLLVAVGRACVMADMFGRPSPNRAERRADR